MQVLRYQKEMTHPWSDTVVICSEVDRYSHSQKNRVSGGWKGRSEGGRPCGARVLIWPSSGRKEVYVKWTSAQQQKFLTPRTEPHECQSRGRAAGSCDLCFCIRLARRGAGSTALGRDKFCKHVCWGNDVLALHYMCVCSLTQTFGNVWHHYSRQKYCQFSKRRYFTKILRLG